MAILKKFSGIHFDFYSNVRVYFIVILLLLSCKSENCDLEYYPSPPYGNPDYTDYYAPDAVKYVYVCYSGSFNRIVTYQIVGECWEMYYDDEYNLNCN